MLVHAGTGVAPNVRPADLRAESSDRSGADGWVHGRTSLDGLQDRRRGGRRPQARLVRRDDDASPRPGDGLARGRRGRQPRRRCVGGGSIPRSRTEPGIAGRSACGRQRVDRAARPIPNWSRGGNDGSCHERSDARERRSVMDRQRIVVVGVLVGVMLGGVRGPGSGEAPLEDRAVHHRRHGARVRCSRGTGVHDVICARGGNDTCHALSGDDIVRGGNGNDVLQGDHGDDLLAGGPDGDRHNGGDGNDRMIGGRGRAQLQRRGRERPHARWSRSGTTFYPAGGDDLVRAGGGGDLIWDRRGDDVFSGQGGPDRIQGYGGRDHIYGGPATTRASTPSTASEAT